MARPPAPGILLSMDTDRSPLTPLSRDRLLRIGLSAWPPVQHEHFVRVSPGILTGTRL